MRPFVSMRAETFHHRSAYPVLLAFGALDAAGYSLIAPLLPVISSQTGSSAAVIGALVGAFPLGIVVGFPIAGRAVIRRSIRTTLLVSLALLASGSLAFVFTSSLPAYFGGRFVMGVGSAGLWIAVTFATLERWPGQEYLCMSRIFAAYSVGGLIGPALGATGGIRTPFVLYLALTVAAVPAAILLRTPSERRPFSPDRSTLRLGGFWAASAGVMFAYLALGLSEGVLPLHFATGFDQGQLGLVYVVLGLIVAGAASLAARYAPVAMVVTSTVLVTLGLGLAGASAAPIIWVVAMAVVGIGVGFATTGSTGILLEAVPTERIVTAMVVWSEIGIVGYLVGPLAGGLVTQSFGFGMLVIVPLVAAVGTLGILAVARSR